MSLSQLAHGDRIGWGVVASKLLNLKRKVRRPDVRVVGDKVGGRRYDCRPTKQFSLFFDMGEYREFQLVFMSDQPPRAPREEDSDGGVATETSKPELKRPPMYKVILLNDDYTPMEFVVHVLEIFFAMDREKATQIMLTVHTTGSAVVAIYPRDIAESKSEQVNLYAQENQHPLICKIEMTD